MFQAIAYVVAPGGVGFGHVSLQGAVSRFPNAGRRLARRVSRISPSETRVAGVFASDV